MISTGEADDWSCVATDTLHHPTAARRRIRLDLGASFGVVLLVLLVIGSSLQTSWLPRDPMLVNLSDRFVPVGGEGRSGARYLFGTDALGRDIASRLMYSGRYTLLVAGGAAFITLLLAAGLGVAAGFTGGAFEAIVLRAADALLSLPVILVAVALAAILGRGLGTLVAILAFTGWADCTRVIRADTLALRERPFVESSRALGSGAWRIVLRDLLPNLMSTITVMGTYLVSRFILLESSISFLGVGISPPASSWGAMVGEARQYIFQAPWASVIPGLLITLTILSLNFLGDAIRDYFDPAARSH